MFEDRIYKRWEEEGAFRASVDPQKKPYTIVMPPPNITGQLHMGHALDHTLQDILIRYKRMKGFCALWLPGSDHASIATEVKVVDHIRRTEGKTKEDLGRDEFLKRAWAWKEEYGGRITRQCRRLGDSCDWTRERFTMDEGCSKAVRHYFVALYQRGLIYRGKRLVNYCPACGTTLSDAEVEHRDVEGLYWYFRYPAAKKGDPDMIVATSRPETMFGDVAIAVHPSDDRYRDRVGKKVILPIVGREIPIISDPYPDPTKGTGAVKITPAHDPNDFAVGERAGLPVISCINEDATMNAEAGIYEGMDRYECRKAWVQALTEAGYLVKTEKVTIPVGECYRCHTVIEPLLSEQWFVKMEELAKPAIQAVETGALHLVPDRFTKTYLNWLYDIRDWCISRQLWWGHRIPAWYCKDCGESIVSEQDPAACPHCGSRHLEQDPDVLDTWFSSALWPMSTLGWPEKKEDFAYFYPTDVLVTGYDIIFFWVVRMVFSACAMTGQVPFHHVLLHGLVRDEQGRKMSKSLNNGIDPLKVIEEYGADALRFMLATGMSPGNDMRFMLPKLEAARNFANKLWNAARFVILNIQSEDGALHPLPPVSSASLRDEDRWIITRTAEAAAYIDKAMDHFDISMAGQKVYELIWGDFCDWYIELAKGRLRSGDESDRDLVRAMLTKILKDLLKLLHPFMPFITEEIWGFLPSDGEGKGEKGSSLLISAAWPQYGEEAREKESSRVVETAMEAVRAIRNLRAEAGGDRTRKLKVWIRAEGQTKADLIRADRLMKDMAGLTDSVYMEEGEEAPKDVMTAVMSGAQIFVPLADLLDLDAEWDRLSKECERLKGEVRRGEAKLRNQGFVQKAPASLVEAEKQKLADYRDQLDKIEAERQSFREKISR